MNPNTCDFAVYAEKAVVENVEDDCLEMSLADAKMLNPKYEIGDTVQIPLDSRKFGRIATQNAKERDSAENTRGRTQGTVQRSII